MPPALARDDKQKPKAVRELIDLLDDPYIWARREAIRALAKLEALCEFQPGG